MVREIFPLVKWGAVACVPLGIRIPSPFFAECVLLGTKTCEYEASLGVMGTTVCGLETEHVRGKNGEARPRPTQHTN